VPAGGIDRAVASFARPLTRFFQCARAGDLPIEMPTHFELAINFKTAKALGLAVPPTLFSLVPHEVIE
jgi:putative ABC transport system substrate-binding protein